MQPCANRLWPAGPPLLPADGTSGDAGGDGAALSGGGVAGQPAVLMTVEEYDAAVDAVVVLLEVRCWWQGLRCIGSV